MSFDEFNNDTEQYDDSELDNLMGADESLIEDAIEGFLVNFTENISLLDFKSLSNIDKVDIIMSWLSKINDWRYERRDNYPSNSCSVIIVESKDLYFESPLLLSYSMSLSSVVDVAPKTNGKVEINFTFNHIADQKE